MVDHGLGSLHDVSLEEAREKATDARGVRRDGGDPIQAKREAEEAARIEAAKAITFGAAAKRFIKANRAGWKNAKHADQWGMTLLGTDQKGKPTKNDYCKTIRDLPIGAIDTTLVLRIIEPIWASKTETASRIRSRIEQVIDAAKAKGEFKGETRLAGRGISITCSRPRRRFARSAIIRRCLIGNCPTSCASSANVMVPLRQLLSFKS